LTSPLSGLLRPSSGNYDHLVTETIQRGTFEVTVTERGTVDSLRNAILTSKVEGSTTIISIVPEGTTVQEGDLVCELDSSVLADKETQQQIKVTQAKAALEQAREEVEIQKTQNESDKAAADLQLLLANIDLRKFKEGDYRQQEFELDSQVQVNVENLSRAKEYLSFLERLVKKGYRMQSDLDAERIAFNKAKNDRKVAEDKLLVLKDFTKLRTESELEANVKEFKLQIARTESRAKAAMAQKLADLEAKSLTNEVEGRLLARLQTQIENCKLYAPQSGQVVYANTRDGRSSDQVLIEVGATVRERQAIINLPDLDAMKVNARIHESRISMIRAGLSAIVKIDAAPTEEFHGVIDTVSSVPSSVNNFNRDLKEYDAILRLTDDLAKINQLRPGLTATVEILVDQRNDILQAPVQSLVSILDQRFMYVLTKDGPELRDVKIGESNERTVEILEGVQEGDRVVMNPRTQFNKEIAELETRLAKEKLKETPKDKALRGLPPGADGTPPIKPEPKAPPAESAQPPRRDPQARFQSMDQNRDGQLSAEELSDQMKPRFDEMDTNHNGTVDQQEFTTFAAQFRRPPNATAGGN